MSTLFWKVRSHSTAAVMGYQLQCIPLAVYSEQACRDIENTIVTTSVRIYAHGQDNMGILMEFREILVGFSALLSLQASTIRNSAEGSEHSVFLQWPRLTRLKKWALIRSTSASSKDLLITFEMPSSRFGEVYILLDNQLKAVPVFTDPCVEQRA